MLVELFTIRDTKIEQHEFPFFVQNAIQAIRTVQGAMQDPTSRLSQFSEDFEIFQIGTLDTVTAKFENLVYPKFVMSCTTIKNTLLKQKLEAEALINQPEVKNDSNPS